MTIRRTGFINLLTEYAKKPQPLDEKSAAAFKRDAFAALEVEGYLSSCGLPISECTCGADSTLTALGKLTTPKHFEGQSAFKEVAEKILSRADITFRCDDYSAAVTNPVLSALLLNHPKRLIYRIGPVGNNADFFTQSLTAGAIVNEDTTATDEKLSKQIQSIKNVQDTLKFLLEKNGNKDFVAPLCKQIKKRNLRCKNSRISFNSICR